MPGRMVKRQNASYPLTGTDSACAEPDGVENTAGNSASVQRLLRLVTYMAVVTTVLAIVSVVSLVWVANAVDTQTCVTKTAAAIQWSNSLNDDSAKQKDSVTVYSASPEELRDFFDGC